MKTIALAVLMGTSGWAGAASAQVVVAAPGPTSLEGAGAAARAALDSSREERTKKALGELRAALSIYYGDHEGVYPASPAELVPRHIRAIPTAVLPGTGHAPSARVAVSKEDIQDQAAFERAVGDTGGWIYIGNPRSPLYGTIHVDSHRKDSRGVEWWMY